METPQPLECEKRFANRENRFTCGPPIHDIPDHENRNKPSLNLNGIYGMCCIRNDGKIWTIPPTGRECPYEHLSQLLEEQLLKK